MRARTLCPISAALFSLSLLGSCGSAVSQSTAALSGTPLTVARQDFEYSYELGAGASVYTIKNKPSWASFSGATGKLSGTPRETGTYADILISSSEGELPAFSIVVTGDPIKSQAWHLHNTGQKTFSTHAATAGIDLNLSDSLRSGLFGEGIRIAISDSGTEINHEDLSSNVLTGESRDYRSGATSPYYGNPSPSSASDDGDHGTSVAGVIAAVGWNGIGSRGIAPEAKFATFNFLSDEVTTTAALEVNQLSGDFDIFNQSWGIDATADGVLPSYYVDELVWGVTNQPTRAARLHLGSLYVKSAGNSFKPEPDSAPLLTSDANSDYYNATPYIIVTGALNAKGVKASYSSVGSTLWVSGFGGEDGAANPAILTTDRSGCSKGYSVTGETLNDFENGSPLNASCSYTSGFNGTSSAAPTISGAIALILSANPALGWRDVKHILAETSAKVDANFAPIVNRSIDPSGYVWDEGWITNAAGYHFHNYYGFGKIDVDAAIAMAKNYSSNWGQGDFTKASYSHTGLTLAIPDDSATGVTSTVSAASTITIESVEIELSVTHAYVGDVAVELVSPSGTKSILLHMNNTLSDDTNLNAMKLISNAFYGESATGTWTLRVLDGADQDSGTLTAWKLTLYGHIESMRLESSPSRAPAETPLIAKKVNSLKNSTRVDERAQMKAFKAARKNERKKREDSMNLSAPAIHSDNQSLIPLDARAMSFFDETSPPRVKNESTGKVGSVTGVFAIKFAAGTETHTLAEKLGLKVAEIRNGTRWAFLVAHRGQDLTVLLKRLEASPGVEIAALDVLYDQPKAK